MKLRPATFSDESILLEWKNDPIVRENSSYKGSIPQENHARWLHRILSDNETHLYIAEIDAIPIGQGRIERSWKAISKKMDCALIGYSIDANERSKGYGKILARKLVSLARNTHGYSLVMARIKRTNRKSIAVAIHAGVDNIELF